MDAEFKKEQISTLFVWVGALEGGLGGGVPQGCPPQKVDVPQEGGINVAFVRQVSTPFFIL